MSGHLGKQKDLTHTKAACVTVHHNGKDMPNNCRGKRILWIQNMRKPKGCVLVEQTNSKYLFLSAHIPSLEGSFKEGGKYV